MRSLQRFCRLTVGMIAFALIATSRADAQNAGAPVLLLDVGYGDAVTAILVDPPTAPSPSPSAASLKCAPKDGTYVLVPSTKGADGIPFCVTASLAGLVVMFQLADPFQFVSPSKLSCTRLRDNKNIVDVFVRVGRSSFAHPALVYDGARAECGLDAGFLYALAVETQSDPGFVPVRANTPRATWSFTVPWNRLHLGRDAARLLVSVNGAPFELPVQINRANYRYVSADVAPFIRLNAATPAPGAAAPRLHDVELNGTYNPDRHNLLAASFAQNQSTVAVQSALSQALSLAPIALPASKSVVVIGQNLQSQGQTLFSFQQPSLFLGDPSVKPLFDALPFAATKVRSLASGYAYGYTSEPVKAAAFYGLQGPRTYAGAATVTLAVVTPAPSPDPRPTPKFDEGFVLTSAGDHKALEPPPPPAPFLESGTESTPPFQISFLNGFTVGKGVRDTIDAMAFEGHVFQNSSSHGSDYRAETFNVFGRLERDFRTPALTVSPSSSSQFIGESSTFTTGAAAKPGSSYFQLRETVAVQVNDRFFSPTAGTATWVSSLSGPVAHVTASVASGKDAKYYALDLFGFRLTSANGDIAAQEGWQVSIPLPHSDTGWLLSGGSETQTVSDRLAAVEQGLVSNYASAVTQVLPTPGPNGVIKQPAVRPQRLGNVKLNSPWIFRSRNGVKDKAQVQLVAGYDIGTVTECSKLSSSKPSAPAFGCLTANDNRFVGGIFVQRGKLEFGATDTSVSSGSAALNNAAHNLGTTGGLPGSTTVYLTYSLCPQITFAYTNAAFPAGVPLPQQGTTLSGQMDFPITAGAQQFDLILGYFNERTATNQAFNESGFSAVLRLGTPFRTPAKPRIGEDARRATCNWGADRTPH